MPITTGATHINEGAYSTPSTKKHHRRKLPDGACNYSNIYSSASPTGVKGDYNWNRSWAHQSSGVLWCRNPEAWRPVTRKKCQPRSVSHEYCIFRGNRSVLANRLYKDIQFASFFRQHVVNGNARFRTIVLQQFHHLADHFFRRIRF